MIIPENKVLSYRLSHKRCRYCKWMTYMVPRCKGPVHKKCIAKNIVINHPMMPRPWCACYEVDLSQIPRNKGEGRAND